MKAKILTYRTIIKKDGKYYHGWVPSLPGCHTQGISIDETKKNLKEAIRAWIEVRPAAGGRQAGTAGRGVRVDRGGGDG